MLMSRPATESFTPYRAPSFRAEVGDEAHDALAFLTRSVRSTSLCRRPRRRNCSRQ